jgi:dTMP kinase
MGAARGPRGFFLTFEGVEGSGKSTQQALLADRLRDEGYAVTELREPGDTGVGERVRSLLLSAMDVSPAPAAELCLFLAARAQLVAEVIRGALAAGQVVLCDRFADSTAAYQGFGRGLDLGLIHSLNRLVTEGIWPDLTVLLDLDPAVGLARRAAHAGGTGGAGIAGGHDGLDRFEQETLAFHQRVREGYLVVAQSEPARFLVLNANRDAPAIAADVWKDVEPRLRRASLTLAAPARTP